MGVWHLIEKDQMEQKKDEMTVKDVWIAMANGECVKSFVYIHRVYEYLLQYWDPLQQVWKTTYNCGSGPYSIVSDPSKPVESELDYLMIEFAEFVDEKVGGKYEPEQDLNQADLTRLMLDFINQKFRRKDFNNKEK